MKEQERHHNYYYLGGQINFKFDIKNTRAMSEDVAVCLPLNMNG